MSVQDVELAVQSVQPVIRDWRRGKGDDFVEAETRRQIIDSALTALGWNLDDKRQIISGYFVSEGEGYCADYVAFTEKGDPTILIEAKRLSKDTRDPENYGQAAWYAGVAGAKNLTVVVTTGEYWDIYHLGGGRDPDVEVEQALGLLWPGATAAEQAQRLYGALSRDKHWKLRNRGGGMRRWR